MASQMRHNKVIESSNLLMVDVLFSIIAWLY